MTAQRNPGVLFRRVVGNGNVLLAETTAPEVGWLTLEEAEALGLLELHAAHEPDRYHRAAGRWLTRYVDEGAGVTPPKVQIATAALSALRGGDEAVVRLLGTWRGVRRTVLRSA